MLTIVTKNSNRCKGGVQLKLRESNAGVSYQPVLFSPPIFFFISIGRNVCKPNSIVFAKDLSSSLTWEMYKCARKQTPACQELPGNFLSHHLFGPLLQVHYPKSGVELKPRQSQWDYQLTIDHWLKKQHNTNKWQEHANTSSCFFTKLGLVGKQISHAFDLWP